MDQTPTPKTLPPRYDPSLHETKIHDRWMEAGVFGALPDRRQGRFVVMMPLPNVTGALHLGHAMDNVLQDLLVRWHRMAGDNTLWMAGTDHAGIATQAVVEKRLLELEGKTRHDLGREALVARIWSWKETFQQRILNQQQRMGCSCDWKRQRFTMDAVCSRAVREAFFRLFRDGLIYRGTRMVNWDCHLKTAVSDDEVYHETVAGHFWHIRYPFTDARKGEPDHIVVATTRPETLLGDTAVAVHPAPEEELGRMIASIEERLVKSAPKERPQLTRELAELKKRRDTHLPKLKALASMAQKGRHLRVPLAGRIVPLIGDTWARPDLGSGCVKITPGHDHNDYEVWTRHADEIAIINILNPDGTLNHQAGSYAGQDRLKAREGVIHDLKTQDLIEKIEEREIEIGHSDRSKTPVEPFLSDQWFVSMGDRPQGVVMGRDTDHAFRTPGLAQAAIEAVEPGWRSKSGLELKFHPDQERYAATYKNWLAEKRDWCISRQLWWGHRIPIWQKKDCGRALGKLLEELSGTGQEWWWAQVRDAGGKTHPVDQARLLLAREPEALFELQVCVRSKAAWEEQQTRLRDFGLEQDPDVLDTWFSSALWPHSTLGWPDPETAPVDPGQSPCGAGEGRADMLSYYYPGSCLVTGRDIITLWVARMVIMGLYNMGDLPFADVFLHANILDGRGERMSKSRGNGIDPVDIIQTYGTDAMRYVLCDMQTGTQDIRLPVQAISPFTGKTIDLAAARHGRSVFTYICPESGREFDVLGTIKELPSAQIISERFEAGRNFCNKLWNAARFVLMKVGRQDFRPLGRKDLALTDRWILSRLQRTIGNVQQELAAYNPSAALSHAREFLWGSLCDWYLELVKPRLSAPKDSLEGRQVLAFCLDQTLRLLHPFLPFITERLFLALRAQVPVRGIEAALDDRQLLAAGPWPEVQVSLMDAPLEQEFEIMQRATRAIREIRAKSGVAQRQKIDVTIRAQGIQAQSLQSWGPQMSHMAGIGTLAIGPKQERPPLSAAQVIGELEIFVSGVLDQEKERERLEKQAQKLQGRLLGCQRKLANKAFLVRAPKAVVEREEERLIKLRQELERLRQNLDHLT